MDWVWISCKYIATLPVQSSVAYYHALMENDAENSKTDYIENFNLLKQVPRQCSS